MIPISALQLALEMAWTEFGSQTGKTTPLRAYLIGRIRPFVSIKYLLWGSDSVKHARYFWLLLAEGHLTQRLFGAMVRRIWAVPLPAG